MVSAAFVGIFAFFLLEGMFQLALDVTDCFTLFYALDKAAGCNSPGTVDIVGAITK